MKTHNHMTVVLAVVFAAVNAAAANFPLGTHLVKGTLKDWQNKVLTSSAAVTIQAVATNGSVIASTKVADPTADGYNFLLQIPLSTTATSSTAAFGDRLNCVLIQASGLSLAVEPIEVGNANDVSTVSLAFIDTKSYTSTNDAATTVSVPAEYVDTIAAWMEAYEIEGELAAREAQGLLELQIAKLQDLVANARVIDESQIGTDKVQMLNKVKVKNLNTNQIMNFTLVSEQEADFMAGKLAAKTPIGQALMGHSVGDVVEAKVPAGVIKFEILDITL